MYATQEKKFKSVSMLVWIGFFTWITCHGVLSFIPDALPCSLFGKFGDDVCRVVKEYNYGIKIASLDYTCFREFLRPFIEQLFGMQLIGKSEVVFPNNDKWIFFTVDYQRNDSQIKAQVTNVKLF
ncbi:uncharacterized protein LOC124452908 isoform X1 [Xenia sp. Carnegie-2017]|uniref:uncharacterized protein LOC124452908 isoform X1 n=1 Tax=Xenia sp. Carnegie-2017 TaxID=2897299 RepID=UPI001F04855E|nr:uncharacterized protein LOC124452908 isoform X1 [Xenia sp. Carnegie-2017]